MGNKLATTDRSIRSIVKKKCKLKAKLAHEWTMILILIVIASLSRIWDLGNLYGAFHDEAAFATIALRIYQGTNPVWQTVWANPSNHPNLAFPLYLEAACFHIFGVSDFSHRLPHALLGVLTVLGTYMLVRGLYNRRIAFLSAILFSLSAWHIASNRTAFCTPGHFFAIYSMCFLIYGLKRKSALLFVASGSFLALALMSYEPTAIILPIFLLYLFTLGRKKFSNVVPKMTISFLATIFLPVFHGLYYNFGRSLEEKAMYGGPGLPIWLNLKSLFLKQTVTLYSSVFFDTLKSSITAEATILFSLFPLSISFLALVGFGILLLRRKGEDRFLLIWVIVALAIFPFFKHMDGTIQSRYMIGLLPAPYILAAISLYTLFQQKENLVKKKLRYLSRKFVKRTVQVLPIALVFLAIISESYFLYNNYYYGWIERTGGMGLLTGGHDQAGFFNGNRDACLYIKENASPTSIVISDGATEQIMQQVGWYTQMDFEGEGRVFTDYSHSLINLTKDNAWRVLPLKTVTHADAFFVMSAREGYNGYLKDFQDSHPGLEPEKIIYFAYNNTPALMVYRVKIMEPIQIEDYIVSWKDDSFEGDWKVSADGSPILVGYNISSGIADIFISGKAGSARTYFDLYMEDGKIPVSAYDVFVARLKGSPNARYRPELYGSSGKIYAPTNLVAPPEDFEKVRMNLGSITDESIFKIRVVVLTSDGNEAHLYVDYVLFYELKQ